jgi:hypothetical protein
LTTVACTGFRLFAPLQSDLSVGRNLVFAVPNKMLDVLEARCSHVTTASASWQQERRWAARAESQNVIGFWRGRAVMYPYFRRSKLELHNITGNEDAYLKRFLLEQNNAMRAAEAVAQRRWQDSKGFAGWLVTNPAFLDEHDVLLVKYRREIEEWGLPPLSRPVTRLPLNSGSESNSRLSTFYDDMDAFYRRWQITGLAAPYLPLPMQAQLPLLAPSDQQSVTLQIPANARIPDAAELRRTIAEAFQRRDDDHLTKWTELIRSDNQAKNPISKYATLFELQHYCRIIHQRLPIAFDKPRSALDAALAHTLDIAPPTVRAYFRFLARRLDVKWMTRKCGFELCR